VKVWSCSDNLQNWSQLCRVLAVSARPMSAGQVILLKDCPHSSHCRLICEQCNIARRLGWSLAETQHGRLRMLGLSTQPTVLIRASFCKGHRIAGWICLGNPPTNGALKPSCSALLPACLKWRFAARNRPTLFHIDLMTSRMMRLLRRHILLNLHILPNTAVKATRRPLAILKVRF
jgi:hypothetical protein